LDCASVTAGRLLPEEVQEEAKAQAATNAFQILTKKYVFTPGRYLDHNISWMSIDFFGTWRVFV
jgi:hypothetical protein